MNADKRDRDELERLVENIASILGEDGRESSSEEVIAESKNPANFGRMEDSDGVGLADGLCGDTMEMFIKVTGSRIVRCSFHTEGCAPTIACGSVLTKLVTGMTLTKAGKVQPSELEATLRGLPEDHRHCAVLAVMALRNAIRNHDERLPERGRGR